MRFFKHPLLHTAVIALISVFYSAMFILIAEHVEFQRLLNHSATLSSRFFNNWTARLREGILADVGVIWLVLTAVIVLFAILHRRRYDEYQAGILRAGFTVTGVVMVLLFPLALLLILSDRNYAIEVMTMLVIAHWSVVLAADAGYVLYCFCGQFGRARRNTHTG
ncbi:MAG: hypothetical protein IKD37_07135 [Clostridia bacterium]|nr:hypothetical protein [Clostridia bacterium]